MRSLAKLIRWRFDVLNSLGYLKKTKSADYIILGGGFII